MEVRLEKDGPAIGSASQAIDSFAVEIKDRQARWRGRVTEDPSAFPEVQADIRQQYQLAADLMTAAVLAEATGHLAMQDHVQQVRQNARLSLKAPPTPALEITFGGRARRLAPHVVLCAPFPQTRGKPSTATRPENLTYQRVGK